MKKIELQRSMGAVTALILGLVFLISAPAAALTIGPNSWNIIGLDSNTPASGPYRFPVGAKVCGGTPGADESATLTWDSGGTDNGTYIYLRAGSANPATITYGADGCADAYFEVEVNRTSAAFDQTRRYHISVPGSSTTTPRELYVEHLVSQSRNYITNVKLNGVSIPAGGSMNLMVGNTYTIELYGGTATQGYNQFEEFINFPNTVFQVLSVSTDYSANDSPYVSTTGHKYLYADACQWENDPNSPYYRSCFYDYKSGGNNVVTTYTVKIIGGGGTSETLSTLLYDFSGSSFHYNADFSTGARYASVYDASSITISKSMSPSIIAPGGVSTMTITLNNPTSEAVSGVTFTDTFPTSPGQMSISSPLAYTNTCGGTLTDNLGGTLDATTPDVGIKLSGGTIAANSSCTITVDVTAPATGDYTNTTGTLYINTTTSTGNSASGTLTVSSLPAPPASCASPVTLATWTMPTSGQGSGGPPPPYTTISPTITSATASALLTGAGSSTINAANGNPANSWLITDAWPLTSTPPGGGTSPAFQFAVAGASAYNGVSITFDYRMLANGDWTAGNHYYVYSNSGSGWSASPVNASPYTATKGTWQTGATGTASSYGSSVTFSIEFDSRKSSSATSLVYLDNVVIKGCPRTDPPTVTKSFASTSIAVNGTSTLTFNITNPNAGTALSGVAIRDTFPTLPDSMTVASPLTTTNTCGGSLQDNSGGALAAGDAGIRLTGGTLSAGGSCSFSVNVTAATEGQYQNASGSVSATESGSNTTSSGSATASLTVIAPPTIAKSFSPTSIYTGNTSTLTFTITNPNSASALTSIAFSDTLPSGLSISDSTTSQCGGTNNLTTTAATRAISLTGGSLAAGGSCTFNITVTGSTAGTKNNTTGTITAMSGAVALTGGTASASIIVSDQTPSIDLTKQVSTSPAGPWTKYVAVAAGSSVYYRFKVYNSGDTALYNIGITETVGSISPSCSWPVSLAVGDTAACVSSAVTATAGSNVNTAYATAKYPSGGTTYNSANSSATYATTGLTLAKSATETYFTAAGDVLHYSYLATNSGYATLTGPATVADNKSTDESCPALATIGDNDNYFDPSESVTCTATYTVIAADVTAGQVTNTATATVGGATSPTANKTVSLAMPSLTVIKSVTAYSDPINGTTGPKAIPGSFMTYTILVTNTGLGQADNNSTVIADPIPANTELFVGDINGAGSGPVKFTTGDPDCSAGTAASGLCYDYANPGACAGDNIEFSNTAQPGPYTYGYIPTADGNGCDAGVTSLKVTLGGPFNGTVASGGSNTSFCLQLRVRVK